MPTYLFNCAECGDVEIVQSIHSELPNTHHCGSRLTRIYTVPLTSARVKVSNEALNTRLDADAQFASDHPAYKRLRDNGVQPKGIDGSAELEAKANESVEIEMGTTFGRENAKKVKEGVEISKDMGIA